MAELNPNSNSFNNSFPTTLIKIAVVFAVVPFLMYGWDNPALAGNTEGIRHLWILIGGIATVLMVPVIIIFEIRKLPQSDRFKYYTIIIPLDIIGFVHILYGLGYL